MLRGLDIRDLLLIDRLSVEFRPGLNVLTGETGAGKSILLDALGFVLGWRGRADLVRAGADTGEVVAVFDLGAEHPVRAVLDDAGLPGGDELILRRTVTADGRKTAFVNDRRTTGEVLRALSDGLVELHGQHDDHGLMNPRGHRALLDAFAGHDGLVAAARSAWGALSRAEGDLAAARAAVAEAAREEEFLRHAVAELDRLAPEPGEDAALDARRRLMQGAAKVGQDIARAAQALGGEGAEGQLADALRWLEGAAGRAGDALDGRLDAPVAALGRALAELSEVQAGVDAALDALAFDPGELERVEERLFAIRAAARKHGVAPDALGAHADGLRARLAALDAGEAGIARLTRAVAEARAAQGAAADALSVSRRAAAVALDGLMAAELPPLKLDRAVFLTRVEAGDPGPDGADAVAFTVSTNPGLPPGPLDRIASGGELSRFMLALKVCLTRRASGLTLIFDEIDRGVGGATADAVGRRLAALAAVDGGQVLAVTHSPQVAARAAHHWRVEKRVAGGQTLSTVVPLAGAARADEIARMLAGDTITEAARAAAQALLAG
jgi:DNA repair protein RecN (Recombination protein N)